MTVTDIVHGQYGNCLECRRLWDWCDDSYTWCGCEARGGPLGVRHVHGVANGCPCVAVPPPDPAGPKVHRVVHVGVTGSRNGLAPRQRDVLTAVLFQLREQHRGVVLHHGDCIGVDEQGAQIAAGLGYALVAHPPGDPVLRAFVTSHRVLPEQGYLERDRAIVHAVRYLVACPDGPRRPRSGTWFTIDYARRAGRCSTWIVQPDGLMQVAGTVTGGVLA